MAGVKGLGVVFAGAGERGEARAFFEDGASYVIALVAFEVEVAGVLENVSEIGGFVENAACWASERDRLGVSGH